MGHSESNLLLSVLHILINFLQVTGIAVFINVKWTAGVLNTLWVAGKNLEVSNSVLQVWACHKSNCLIMSMKENVKEYIHYVAQQN